MANDLVDMNVFGKAKPAAVFAKLDPNQDKLSDGIGSGYAVIGYRGKTWSVRHRGEKKNFVRPDDGSPVGHLDVVILRAAPHKSKSYYPDFNDAAAGERPTCASMDGIVPDNDVIKKQSEQCALCSHNEFKTNANGRKGKECSDYKRLAVFVLPSQTAKALGQPLLEPAFLRVPAASLSNLGLMGDQMAAQGWAYPTYITRVTFDPNEAHPKMVFRAIQKVEDADAQFIEEMRTDPVTGRIVNGDIVLAGPRLVSSQPQPEPMNLQVQLDPAPAPASKPEPVTLDLKATVVEEAAPSGSMFTAAVTQPTPDALSGQAATQTVADTGEPEYSDAELDAMINKSLGK